MNTNQPTIASSLNISQEAVKSIICETVQNIEGVAGLDFLPVRWKDYFLRAKRQETVRVESNAGTVCILIGIKIQLGTPVKSLCESIQEQVKAAVQEMTGLTVSRVDLYVASLDSDSVDSI